MTVLSFKFEVMNNCKEIGMRKMIPFAVALCCVLISVPTEAQRGAVWEYHTRESYDKVYVETLQAVTAARFIVRSEDKQQGTINAQLMGWGGGEYAAALVVVGKEEGGVFIRVMFTRRSGDIGTGPKRWAKDFGGALKKALPDLTVEERKQ